MKALSIRQPWAWAILHAGKRIENRDWSACHYRGPVLLHAAKGCTRDEYSDAVEYIEWSRNDLGMPPLEVPTLAMLDRGGLVGIARIADVKRNPEAHRGYEVPGALGLVLADVRPLPFVPFKGALGFFGAFLAGLPHATAYERAWDELSGGRKT